MCTLTHAVDESWSSVSYAYQTGIPIRGKAAWLEIVMMRLYNKGINVICIGFESNECPDVRIRSSVGTMIWLSLQC